MGVGDEHRGLSHTDEQGQARMVDVGDKAVTERHAVAEGFVRISTALADAIRDNTLKKGNLLEVCRLAGIMGAKRTDELIPLCHPLPIDAIEVHATLEHRRVRLWAFATTHARTGIEMEALTAVAIAALTVIDMGKAIDPGMVIEGIRLLEKRGGQNGNYTAPAIDEVIEPESFEAQA